MARDGAQPSFWFQMDPGDLTTRHAIKGTSTDATLSGYAASLLEVSPVSSSLDPYTREAKTDSCELIFAADRMMVDLLVAFRLKGKAVTIKVGERELAGSDYAPYFAGIIDGSPIMQRDGRVQMKCATAMAFLRDIEIACYIPRMHPLEAIEQVLIMAGVPASLYDATSLDPSDSDYDDFSHYCIQLGVGSVGYVNDFSISKPRPALDIISEIAALVDGQLVVREDGLLTFVLFDSSASTVDHFDEDDFSHDDFNVESLDDNLTNRVSVSYSRSEPSQFAETYIENDTESQADCAYPGETERIISDDIETIWLDALGVLQSSITDTATSFDLYFHNTGLCGTNWPGFPAGSQPAWAEASASRLVYLVMEDEIIEIDGITINTTTTKTTRVKDPFDGVVDSVVEPCLFTFSASERGALGTTAVAHSACNVFDVTIPMAMARARVQRFANGVPIVSVRVNPARGYPIQVGDLVSLHTDKYAHYDVESLTSSTKWQVVGKEPSFEGDLGVTLTLAWATQASPASVVFEPRRQPAVAVSPSTVTAVAVRNPMTVTNFVSGALLAPDSGLFANIPSGTWTTGTVTRAVDSGLQEMTASKDNYVYIDAATNSLIIKTVTISDPEPERESSLIPLSMVTTDATDVTSVTDMRATTGLVGTAINPLTVTTPAIADNAVVVAKTGLSEPKTATLRNSTFNVWSRG